MIWEKGELCFYQKGDNIGDIFHANGKEDSQPKAFERIGGRVDIPC